MIADLLCFLRWSGLVSQSVETLRADLPRWERFLRSRGHTVVPHLSRRAAWSPAEIRAANYINLLINQAAGNQALAHQLRTLSGVRAPKI